MGRQRNRKRRGQAARARQARGHNLRAAGQMLGAWLLTIALAIVLAWSRRDDIRGTWFVEPHEYRTVSGVVSRSAVERGRRRGYRYEIAFAYQVHGRRYDSEQVSFGATGASGRAFADAYVTRYPVGREVVVHYKADEPSFAVLEPTVVSGMTGYLVMCALLLATGALGSAWSLWCLRRARDAARQEFAEAARVA